jgi:hypothetical protein
MFWLLILAMLIGWCQGGRLLYNTHHGLETGVQQSDSLMSFLFLNK